MSSLRQIKERIASVTATKKLTASMKLVAVSRLKKKHAAFLKTVPFADEMNRVVRRLVRSIKLKEKENPTWRIRWPRLLNGNGKDQRYVLFIMTSDEGLSGASQVQVSAQAKKVMHYLKSQGKEVAVYIYGTRGVDVIKKDFPEIEVTIIRQKDSASFDLYTQAERIAYLIVEAFHQDQFDVCLFIYNQFKSVVVQHPVIEQVIPNKTFLRDNPWDFLNNTDMPVYMTESGKKKADLKKSSLISAIGGAHVLSSLEEIIFKTDLDGGKRSSFVYDYEPSDMGALLAVLPQFLTAYVYRTLLEAEVSDNAARLMAMDNATRNAGDMLYQLDRSFKRARQSKITTEIAEVSVGSNQKESL